jgi:hypothetical protein
VKLFPGIAFRADGDRFVTQTTRRADLSAAKLERQNRDQADLARIKARSAKDAAVQTRSTRAEFGGVVMVETEQTARRLKMLLDRKFSGKGREYGSYDHGELAAALEACKRMGLAITTRATMPPAKGPRFSDKRVTVKRTIEDPLLKGEELAHQLKQYAENPRGRQPGFIGAEISLALQIGGLARIKGLSEPQREGAKNFRTAAEHAMIGGARAIDYEKPLVDTSGPSAGLVEEIGADARADYTVAREVLGIGTLLLAVAEGVIVNGESVTECAQRLGLGNGRTARRKVTQFAKAASEALGRHYGYAQRPRRRTRVEREELPSVFTEDDKGTRVVLGRPLRTIKADASAMTAGQRRP